MTYFPLPKIDLKLHHGQAAVFRHAARFRILVAGRRFGKTHLSRIELIRAAKGAGRRTIWYVAPTFSMAREIMWDELIEALPQSWIAKKHETRLEVRLINGTVIQLKGADRPDTLRGRALHFCICDEMQDFRPDVWEKVLYPTLTTTKGRALIIGTPKSYNHFYELYAKGQIRKNQRSGQWISWQFPTIMSPFFPPSEIRHARENLDPKTFRQEFEASFESMSGRVYYAFDQKKHVGRYPFNPALPIILGQDFNVDPMSTVIMQRQPSGQVWVVDEIKLPSSNVPEVCDELERRYFRHKAQMTLYPDPAGANRNSSRGESDLDVFRSRGFRKIIYKKKHPLVSDRVATVNGMFSNAEGEGRLFIDEKCRHLIESLNQTIYKAGTPQVDKSQGVEHMCDALGYPIHYLFGNRFSKLVGWSY
ncbi:Phage terminase large subunit [Sphingomonas sp. NFR04]|uniref:terminase large subunit domain-containing protein n=1 Tax=Sphingomonas sp. NFR04 TaxID=1566283 RepID=UPI0008E616E3|nr:terminase family protein [Sphingomonas sp. NFR04]SFJ51016.1 Phage terminase large subunit [Sphingomonas sp. NFR04]